MFRPTASGSSSIPGREALPEGRLYKIRTDKTGLMQLTGDFLDRVPRWSPLGDWISFFSNRSGELNVWKIRPDGSGKQQITEERSGIAAWSPDGLRIVASGSETGGNAGKIFVFDPNRPWREQRLQFLPPR